MLFIIPEDRIDLFSEIYLIISASLYYRNLIMSVDLFSHEILAMLMKGSKWERESETDPNVTLIVNYLLSLIP